MKIQLSILLIGCFVAAAGLIICSCKKEKSTANVDKSHVGVYALISVDGNPVLANISYDNVSMQVVSGVFTINNNGTCSSKMVVILPGGIEQMIETTASCIKNDQTLTIQWQGAGITVGTIDGNTFTMENDVMVFVDRK